MPSIITITVLLLLVISMIYGFYATKQWRRENRGETVRNEKDYFRAGVFYANPHDKRFLVPKRLGGGYTLNFGNPISVVAGSFIIAGLLLFYVMK